MADKVHTEQARTRGEAGRADRSDARVEVSPTGSGGLDVSIESKVGAMYGDSIRQLAVEVVSALGLGDAKIAIEDGGSLPFALAARIESAVRRSGVGSSRAVGEGIPGVATPHPRYEPTARDRFRRSRLYVPGDGPKLMINAGLHGADGVILDLEDSVAPDAKDAARILVRNALATLDFGAAERMVRINQGVEGLDDLDAILSFGVDLVLIPKCESVADVVRVAERAAERRVGGVHLMPIIESAAGALNAFEIASASPHVVALAIGLEDYTADIGAPRTEEGHESRWARAQVVNAARAAGVQPIDSVYSDVGNEAGLRAAGASARSLGFDGMGCIHPRQIRIVHEVFAPSEQEIARAVAVVRAFDDAQRKGLGVVSLGTKMIDPPVVKRALRTVDMAEAMGLLVPSWREDEA
jgi:citrate lyase subunit beta/citryl-CoA lyase